MTQKLTHHKKNIEAVRRYRQSPKGRANRKKNAMKRYYRLREQKLCVLCSAPARDGFVHCQRCSERNIITAKTTKARYVTEGVCTNCGKGTPVPAMRGKNYAFCERCYFKKTAMDCLKTAKYAELIGEKLKSQNYRCAYTGEEIILGLNDSLDHILPISKYPELRQDPTNVEWVTRKVNCMKWDSTREEFIATAYAVIRHYESQRPLAA